MDLSKSLTEIPSIGNERMKCYNKLGVYTIDDLLNYYPRTYIDYSSPVDILSAPLNEMCCVKATVIKKSKEQRVRYDLSIFKVYVSDGVDNVMLTFFNTKFLVQKLEVDKEYVFYGKLTGSIDKKEMSNATFIESGKAKALVPIYGLTHKLSQAMVQNNVNWILSNIQTEIQDFLDSETLAKYDLVSYDYAIRNIHTPQSKIEYDKCKYRLIFNELLIFQLGMMHMKEKNRKSTSVYINPVKLDDFTSALPFTLTQGQLNGIKSIISDMQKIQPMNRLLQGDVGCGKTMVAIAGAYCVAKSGYQTAVMAPTQILATQHYKVFEQILSKLSIKCCLITGNMTAKEKKELQQRIKSGDVDVVIGTHTLFQKSMEFYKLGLVITDEQHRFGVEQRAMLSSKGDNPHLLLMSATPIPRTLSLIIYGDLDVSTITELPKGRQPIETYRITSKIRLRSFNFIKEQIDQGRQAYIVCPLIDESENNIDNELLSLSTYQSNISSTVLGKYRIGLLHGKLKTAEKEDIMQRFLDKQIDILLCTTVVEVGVDVPNSTVMLIENSERFGLSQLHQLRGRVGRGQYKSYCILLSDHAGEVNKQRLEVMCSTNNGFEIANKDLELRGSGDFFGVKQHGLPQFKLADIGNDIEILKQTNILAKELIDKGYLQENQLIQLKVEELFNNNSQDLLS